MITILWRRKELSENFSKDLENIRRNQSELKNTMTKNNFLISNRGNQQQVRARTERKVRLPHLTEEGTEAQE